MGKVEAVKLRRDNKTYSLAVLRQIVHPPEVPRLVVAAYQVNEQAHNILRVCLATLRKFTSQPHELWVIDRTTQPHYRRWLMAQLDVNVVLMNTLPTSATLQVRAKTALTALASSRGVGVRSALGLLSPERYVNGSYANALQLEIAGQLIGAEAKYLMTLQMDVMPSDPCWLQFLMAKFDRRTVAVGVRLETGKGAPYFPHSLGCVLDWQLFRKLNLSFLTELPRWDVSHKAMSVLVEKGYRFWCCRNTYNDPGLIDVLPFNSPYRVLHVDRALNDEDNVIFLHLGRGVVKSVSGRVPQGHFSSTDWVRFAEDYLLA